MLNSNRIPLALSLAAFLTIGLSSGADAVSLFYFRTRFAGKSEADCFKVAGHLARTSFSNPKIGQLDVAGELPGREFTGVFVSITCIGQEQAGVTALSIAAGENLDTVKKAAQRVNNLMNFGFGPVLAPPK